ncbi:expressed unknown protein [Seminavis robusta]|uniref:HSF-type DNA-binding domain-containing protein n=1 Tax=Seminavis robusta TaxID=568900 RepID=A0A9N8GZF1_9STRA|nr:expressed unknown protein [Seminavis robusta]|eukprot:Sro3_g002430.1 n/a (302) ;mRNA; f:152235-153276
MNATVDPTANMSAKDSQAYRLSTKLMKLLDEEAAPDALWWLDSQIFAVEPKYFQTQVLDPHFRGTKYASFLRTMHKMGFARLSRRFDLPKGVVAYACELFQKGKPEMLLKIKMNNSGKQSSASKAAIAALVMGSSSAKDSFKTAAGSTSVGSTSATASPQGSPSLKPVAKKVASPSSASSSKSSTKKTVPVNDNLNKAAAAFPALPGSAAPAPGVTPSAGYLLAKQAAEQDRIRMLRESIGLQEQARRSMMLRNASLFHQPLLANPMLAPLSTPMAAPGTTSNQLLELALLREAMNSQWRR